MTERMDPSRKWLLTFTIMWAAFVIFWLAVAAIEDMWCDWKFWSWEVVGIINLVAHVMRLRKSFG